jgi:PST family polysaccharide transporter
MLVSRVDFSRIGRYLSSSIVIWAISLFAQAYNNLDIVLLGFFRPPSDVGSFTVARRIIGGIAILMILLANAVLPRLSCTFTNDIAQFRSATRKFLRISILIMLTVFLPIFVFSKEILSLTVGQGYVFAALPLKIMVLALVLILFNLPFSTGLIAACYERDVLKQAAASAALSLILNLVLMPKYGMIGGAISFFFAEALALVWILTLYHKRIRIVRSAL